MSTYKLFLYYTYGTLVRSVGMKLICKLCNKSLSIGSYGIFSRDHLKRVHNISSKDYYDSFELTSNENICNNIHCDSETKFLGPTQGYRNYCSVSCKNKDVNEINKIKESNLKKYGVTSPTKTKAIKDKIKKTNLARYGTESTLSADVVREKIKTTNIRKFGTENPMKNKDIKNKAANTNLKRYGHISPLSSQEIKEKVKLTNIERFGVEYPSQLPMIKDKIKTTNIAKYGTEYPNQNKDVYAKTINTCIDKYGVNNPFKLDNVKNKIRDNHINKYGVVHPMQNKDIQKKYKQTMRARYNCEYPLQNDIIKEKYNNTLSERFGCSNPMKLPEYQSYLRIKHKESYWDIFHTKLSLKKIIPKFNIDDYIQNKSLEFECTRCNKLFTRNESNPQKINCGCLKFRSSYEHDIIEWVREIYHDTVKNNKHFTDINTNKRWEADIFIPKLNISIEFHGLYWHSDIHKDANYHQDKYTFFKQQNITLIQIFENEWIHNQDIVKSIIKSKLGINQTIYARKTTIQEIDIPTYRNFIDTNHIQGYSHSKIKIGLFKDNELVAVMGVSKSRFSSKYEWELIRFCNRLNTNVVGGFNKLLKYVLSNYPITTMGTFCDLRYFDGHGYNSSNFVFTHITKPNYFYFKQNDNILYPRTQFQKHKLSKKLPIYDSNKTEYENMLCNKYLRIFDAGNYLFILDNTTGV